MKKILFASYDLGLGGIEISHNGWQTTSISNLDVEDLKRIRKVIRKAIRNHENNNNKRR